MAEYNLYDQKNHSVLIDPETNYEVKLDPKLRESIENHLGKIEYVTERTANKGHFAIVKDKVHGNYNSLRIENEPDGQRIYVKSGFPDKNQAHNYVKQLEREDMGLNKIQDNSLER
ncbi:hypothetical protein [Bacillus xiapuensis]|uniref:Uncharacterized protein n=1 Tax=Bacillus xiapuensis TaxID=2014075 RepID=A0ABU6N5L2_9BACI|nr:hypothetical protein [Bacillus xiapuensis]